MGLSVKQAKALGTWKLDVEAFGLFHAYASHILPSWLYRRTLYYHWRWRYRNTGKPATGGQMTLTDPDAERGLYGKYRVEKVNGKPIGRCFVLDYDNDPHARVALEAYADSCADDYRPLAASLYRELGIDVEMTDSSLIDNELSAYLAEHYRGRWVALYCGNVVAAQDTLRELRDATTGRVVTVLYVPREGESMYD